jgi:hypothetical protein
MPILLRLVWGSERKLSGRPSLAACTHLRLRMKINRRDRTDHRVPSFLCGLCVLCGEFYFLGSYSYNLDGAL